MIAFFLLASVLLVAYLLHVGRQSMADRAETARRRSR
jgi:hypothetical protein